MKGNPDFFNRMAIALVLAFLVGNVGIASSPLSHDRGPVVVIDPGHGGKDPGTIGGKKGQKEKRVTLELAKRLKSHLEKKGRGKVVLTRNRDRSLSLSERNQIANRKECDYFISLHANSAPNRKAEGVEIYYLNRATDKASRRLAERENREKGKSHRVLEGIVSDLIQAAVTEESAELAASIQKILRRQIKAKKSQVKTALFYVLVGAQCPSLLVEAGYLSHPQESKQLGNAAYQRRFTEALAEGILNHWKSRARVRHDL
ncbi:MAG: N-acetylmuramoyl-L-alanine amidase [Deltaproteobacteria bacterium]|nr:N-acetylmuramoyl-L-alanine amidase [Deltaproteobacteria bacterium]MBI4196254.1 N-acetylmuramoyl-L-alanine amidase [Deltaproteobacteria bacterium]